MTKAVIFDMDGLLLDSERPVRDGWLEAAGKHGYVLEESIYLEAVGRNKRDVREVFCRHLGDDFPFDAIYLQMREILEQRFGPAGYEVKDGVIELLEYLTARAVPCVVATSTGKADALARLLKAGILSYFREVSGGDEVSRGKPEPDLFLLAAKKLGIAPQNCLVLEDSGFGARGANQAGMAVIVIPDLKMPPPDVQELALGVFSSMRESRPAVERWLGGSF